MPFQKGQVANPKGRPPQSKKEENAFIRKARKLGNEALDLAAELMQNSENDQVRLKACMFIIERA